MFPKSQSLCTGTFCGVRHIMKCSPLRNVSALIAFQFQDAVSIVLNAQNRRSSGVVSSSHVASALVARARGGGTLILRSSCRRSPRRSPRLARLCGPARAGPHNRARRASGSKPKIVPAAGTSLSRAMVLAGTPHPQDNIRHPRAGG